MPSRMLFAAVLACFTSPLFAPEPYNGSLECADFECRLFQPIRPKEYEVLLKLFIPSDGANISEEEEFTFEGEVSVDFTVTEETSKLPFHASNLQFRSIQIKCREALSFTDAMFTVDSSTVTVHLAKQLEAGSQCSIRYSYTGSMMGSEDGGLATRFVLVGEEVQKWIVYTDYKFPMALPLTLFPCINDSSYMTTFYLTLLHPHGMTAIAPTRLRATVETKDGWTYSIFEKTDEIPSFAVAFAVGHFKNIASKVTPKRTINVWIPHDIKETKVFNISITAAYIEQLENYLDTDYPSSKLDIVGLPKLEGSDEVCSSYRTPASGIIFIDDKSIPFFAEVGFAIARGWFGVLLTPKWWSDGFLSEGFALYLFLLGEQLSRHGKVDHMPDLFFTEDQFIDLQHSSGFTESNAIIENELYCVSREMGMKSASILYMVQRIIGEKNFHNSIKKFLKAHLHGAVTHNDLYASFTESMREAESEDWCGRPLDASTLLSPWLTQAGYPDVLLQSDADGRAIVLSQAVLTEEPSESTWPIPIFLGSQSLKWIPPGNAECAVNTSLILSGTERDLLRPSSLIYSVFVYDNYERTRILKMFSPDSAKRLSEADKMAFFTHHFYCHPNDCSKVLTGNKADTVKVATKLVETTSSSLLLNSVDQAFIFARSMFLDTHYLSLWKEFGKSLFGRRWGSASLTAEMNSSTTQLMSVLLGYAIEFDVSDLRLQSFELFKTAYEQCISNGTISCERLPIDPDRISHILCGAVKHNPSYAFTHLLSYARNFRLIFPDSLDQQAILYYSLSCVENEAMLEEYIREALQTLDDPNLPAWFCDRLIHCLIRNELASDVMAFYLAKYGIATENTILFRIYGRSMVNNWNSPERRDQLEGIVKIVIGSSMYSHFLRQLDFNISAMKSIVEENKEDRDLYLQSMATYFRQYLRGAA